MKDDFDDSELDMPDSEIDREMGDLKAWTPERVRQEALGVIGYLVRPAGRHLWRSMRPGAVVPRNAREQSENARFILKSALEAESAKLEEDIEKGAVNGKVLLLDTKEAADYLMRTAGPGSERPS